MVQKRSKETDMAAFYDLRELEHDREPSPPLNCIVQHNTERVSVTPLFAWPWRGPFARQAIVMFWAMAPTALAMGCAPQIGRFITGHGGQAVDMTVTKSTVLPDRSGFGERVHVERSGS
jgi:hypothetical protein